jgi:hypothetical protein
MIWIWGAMSLRQVGIGWLNGVAKLASFHGSVTFQWKGTLCGKVHMTCRTGTFIPSVTFKAERTGMVILCLRRIFKQGGGYKPRPAQGEKRSPKLALEKSLTTQVSFGLHARPARRSSLTALVISPVSLRGKTESKARFGKIINSQSELWTPCELRPTLFTNGIGCKSCLAQGKNGVQSLLWKNR